MPNLGEKKPLKGILKKGNAKNKENAEMPKKVQFADDNAEKLRLPSSGGKDPMADSSSSKTSAASLQEKMGKIYEQSRSYWDSTIKQVDPIDQKEQDLATLKTLAYIKLGEEIMKQTDLMGCLGKNGTETQLTKIRDGELYAFEKDGQLHITCNEADIDKNKGISLNDAVGRIERGGVDKVKWHLPKVYAIKLEKLPKEDLKVLITDNEDLFNNCKKFIESGAEDTASEVLITYEKDKKNEEKQFFDDNLKQEIKRGEIKGLQLVSGEKSGVDLSGMRDGERAKNNVVAKSPDIKWEIFASQPEQQKPSQKEVKQTDSGREHDVLDENDIDYPIYAILKVAHPDLEKSKMKACVENTRDDLIESGLAKKGKMLNIDNEQVRHHIVVSLRTQEKIDWKRGVRIYMYNEGKMIYKDVEGDNVSLPYEVFLLPKKSQEVEGVVTKEPRVTGLGEIWDEQKTSVMTSTGEGPQIPGKRVHNVSPDGMNCLIHALLRSHGHDLETQEIKDLVQRTRDSLITCGLAKRGEMLNLGDEQGTFVIQYLRSLDKLDGNRGVRVWTYERENSIRHIDVLPGNPPYELFLSNDHFQAVTDDPNNHSRSSSQGNR